MIEFVNVHKRYENGVEAVDNVNLFIGKGEFVFLVGPSGSGKSTLLKLMIREEEADSGKIILNNYKVTSMKDKHVPYLRRSIGIVFQDFRLLPDKTVFEKENVIENKPIAVKKTFKIILATKLIRVAIIK